MMMAYQTKPATMIRAAALTPSTIKRAIKLVAVEGNIGSGKSTLIEKLCRQHESDELAERARYVVVPILEDVKQFSKYGQHDPLALALENPPANRPLCELHITKCINEHFRRVVLSSSSTTHLQHQSPAPAPEKPVLLLTERTLFSPLAFIEAAYKEKAISGFARDYLREETRARGQATLDTFNLHYDGILFLDVEADTCLTRIRHRGRQNEKALSLAGLKTLEEAYREHLECYWQGGSGGSGSGGGTVVLRREKQPSLASCKAFVDAIMEDRL